MLKQQYINDNNSILGIKLVKPLFKNSSTTGFVNFLLKENDTFVGKKAEVSTIP